MIGRFRIAMFKSDRPANETVYLNLAPPGRRSALSVSSFMGKTCIAKSILFPWIQSLPISPNFYGRDNGGKGKDVTNKHATVAFNVCLALNQHHFFQLPKLQIRVKQIKKAKRDARASRSPAICSCDVIRLILVLYVADLL